MSGSENIKQQCGYLKNSTLLGIQCSTGDLKTDFHLSCTKDLCVDIRAAGGDSYAKIPSACHYLNLKALVCAEQGYELGTWPDSNVIEEICRKY